MNTLSIIIYMFCICLLLDIIGCTPKSLHEKELNEYIINKKNGLRHERKIGEITINTYYKPYSLIAAQEIKGRINLTDSEIVQIEKIYKDNLYFVLSMSSNGKEVLNESGSKMEYNQMLDKLLFKMGEHIALLGDGKDTIPLADYIYPRLYAAKSTDMLFAFQMKDISKYKTLEMVVGDLGLRIGTNRFSFKTADILNAPRLEYKKKK